jgi:hypothetical protein
VCDRRALAHGVDRFRVCSQPLTTRRRNLHTHRETTASAQVNSSQTLNSFKVISSLRSLRNTQRLEASRMPSICSQERPYDQRLGATFALYSKSVAEQSNFANVQHKERLTRFLSDIFR